MVTPRSSYRPLAAFWLVEWLGRNRDHVTVPDVFLMLKGPQRWTEDQQRLTSGTCHFPSLVYILSALFTKNNHAHTFYTIVFKIDLNCRQLEVCKTVGWIALPHVPYWRTLTTVTSKCDSICSQEFKEVITFKTGAVGGGLIPIWQMPLIF